MGNDFDADALGEDMARKFEDSDEDTLEFLFEHPSVSYTQQEMAHRVACLRRAANKIRSFCIDVKEVSKPSEYRLTLS
jgi:hypothetical protein